MQALLEKIDQPRQASLIWRQFSCDGFDFLWHFHPEIELTLILEGHGQRFVGDSIETFGPGDLVLLGPNLPHTWHSKTLNPPPATQEPVSAGCEASATAIVIQFPPDFAGPELWRVPEAAAVRDLLRRADRGLHFSPAHHAAIQLIRSMHDQSGWVRILTLLQTLGALATPSASGRELSGLVNAAPLRQNDQRRIDVVCRLLAERYSEPIEQAEAAAAVHLSPSAFSRFFKRMTGRTFVAYLHELRIADACRRLADEERAITEVCFDCGFENVSNFNRVFRKLRGVSPRDYRKQLRAASG